MNNQQNEYSLEVRKNIVKEEMHNLKSPNLIKLEKLEKFDNTNMELILAMLSLKKTNELLFNNFDVLPKEELIKFHINKKYNNKDSFYYFLNYINEVKIINDNEEDDSNNEEIKKKQVTDEEPQLTIDFLEEKIIVKKNKKIKNINLSHDNGIKELQQIEEDFAKKIGIKNINIDDYFFIGEIITIKKLRNKICKYFNELTYFDKNKNNYPDFQSELFFHYEIKNILKTFLELNNEQFIKKINMIKSIRSTIDKVKNNEIQDLLVLNYFFFLLDLEYELKINLKTFLHYNEKIHCYKGAYIEADKNILIIENSEKKIENIDCYSLDQEDIEMLRSGSISLPLDDSFFSLKGILLFREFSSKEGNIIYDTFLPSILMGDIINILYNIENNIFNSESVIKLFKENTYYFPINNPKYLAYTNKECFKIFIDNKINEENLKAFNFGDKIIFLIKKSFMIVNIEHEIGHVHKLLIIPFNNEDITFDSPLVKLKFIYKTEIKLEEGGFLFEFLLYDREINELNMKEIIYINNLNNFSKNLKDYRNDFIELQNHTLKEIFEREAKDNYEINEALKAYNKLSEDEKYALETVEFKTAKRSNYKNSHQLENITFSFGKTKNNHNHRKDKYVISRFTYD